MRNTAIAALCLSPIFASQASGQVNAPYDPAFGAGINWNGFAGGSCYPIALEQLADGDLQLVGLLNYQATKTVLSARLDTNGLLQEDYGRFGAITDTAGSLGDAYWSKAHVFPDGSHLVLGYPGGWRSTLCKFLPNGSPDPDFGINGRIPIPYTTERYYSQLAVLPSGRIVLGGRQEPGSSFLLMGLSPDGGVDHDFGTNGIVSIGAFRECQTLEVLPDGRFLCLAFDFLATQTDALLMFTADGVLDHSFMGDGILSDLPAALDIDGITYYKYLPDGRILLCDDERTARLLADGSGADPTFQPRNINDIRWMEVMADGSVYLSAVVDWRLYHLLPNGEPDPDFGINGVIALDDYREINGILPTTEGVFAYGSLIRTDNTNEIGITRLFHDGSIDSTFATVGTCGYDGHDEDCYAADITVDAAGRVLGVGGILGNYWLARLNSAGRPDTAFANTGIVAPAYSTPMRVLVQGNGTVLTLSSNIYTGETYEYPILTRYSPDGERLLPASIILDANIANYQKLRDALVAPDDHIYTIVACEPSSVASRTYVARLLPDGTFDPGFGTNGIYEDPHLPLINSGHNIGLFPNGDVLAVQTIADSLSLGLGFNKMQLRRLSPQGTPVTTWGLAGRVRTDLNSTAGVGARPNVLRMLPDGSFLIQYTGFGYNDVTGEYVAKFLENGTLDTSFGNGGIVAPGFDLFDFPSTAAMIVQPNGRITIASGVYTEEGANQVLMRLMPDGSPDLSFGTDDNMLLGNSGSLGIHQVDLALDPTGQIVVSGSVNSDPRWHERDWFTFRLLDDLTTNASTSASSVAAAPLAFPNPTTAHTRLAYTLDEASMVTIRTFDAHGTLLAEHLRAPRSAGSHEELLAWPADAAAGTYLARIQCNAWTKVVPVVLER